ncbi:MAG: hypothetical protein K5762_05070 [Bacilli bacterium]|nr:hypothetical protein [Bacilli bacterium]
MNKSRALILLSALSLNLLVSWKGVDKVSVAFYSFTEFCENDEPDVVKTDWGHSFIVIYNSTAFYLPVGYYTLYPHRTVSIGLWQKGATSGTSTGSSTGDDYNGIYYNREEYFYNDVQTMKNAVRYEVTITNDELSQISDLIIEKNDAYNLLTYNCATFATEVFNIVENSSLWTGWGRSPSLFQNDLKDHYAVTYDNEVEYSEDYKHWDSNTSRWTTY